MGNLKRIHVNKHKIKANRKSRGYEEPQPVITVKSHRNNTYGFTVQIDGPSEVVYRPNKPLSCGAELWVETRSPVLVDGEKLIP